MHHAMFGAVHTSETPSSYIAYLCPDYEGGLGHSMRAAREASCNEPLIPVIGPLTCERKGMLPSGIAGDMAGRGQW